MPELWTLGVIAHTMKKIITIGFSAVLLVIVTSLSWQYFKHSRDSKISRILAGTWHADDLGSFTVRSDGGYVWQITNLATGRAATLEGTFQVKDGVLFNTVTKSSRTNAHMPYVSHSQIVRANDREMVIIDGDAGGNVEHIIRKDTK